MDLNGRRPVLLQDSSGNSPEYHQDTDGEYYLGTAGIQAVHVDPNNTSTTNLTSANSYTFTGTVTATLGVAGLQISLKTDQNATIYVDQSNDGSNWDITDSFSYFYSKGGDGFTVQAVSAYYRVRVVLTGTTDTTYFRLCGILCPIVPPLPRSLNTYDRLKTSGGIVDEETGTRVEIDPLGAIKSITPVRLVGTGFEGTTKDTNFWTEAVTGSGAVAQAGQVNLTTGTTADSTVKYTTVNKGRKVPGSTNQLRAIVRLSTDPQVNNTRRWGAYDDNDGFFFQISGTTFGVGSRKGASDTVVSSGSFNGNLGATYTTNTVVHRYTIDYTNLSAKFFVDGMLLHTITGSTASSTNTLTLPVRVENLNSGGNTTDNGLNVRTATIVRLGELITQAIYKFISTNTTTICKYGAGTLQRIVNVDNAGTVVVYDNTAGSGTVIASIDTAKALGTLEFNAPFSTGLTIVTASGAKCSIIYE